MFRNISGKLLALAVLLVVVSVNTLALTQQRPFTADEMFRLQELPNVFVSPDIALSPDGQWLAYVLLRPESTAIHHGQFPGLGVDRGDIWLVSTKGGSAQNLTNGTADATGYWFPIWSPDGQALAMYSTKGGNVSLVVWRRATGQLKQMSERGMDFWLNAPIWVSNRQLACAVLPEGQKPREMIIQVQAAEAAMREWPKAWKGQETTASVLDSGIPSSLEKLPLGQLLLIDIITGQHEVLAEGKIDSLSLSPDGKYLAFRRQVDVIRPLVNKVMLRMVLDNIYHLGVVSVAGKQALLAAGDANIPRGTISWSPDSSELTVPGLEENFGDAPQRTYPQRTYRYRLGSSLLELITSSELELTADRDGNFPQTLRTTWSDKGELLIYARQKKRTAQSRMDWWLLGADGRYRNLTADMKSAPGSVVRGSQSGSLVGAANGDLWEITTDGKPPRNLTGGFERKITSITWLAGKDERLAKMLIVSVRHGDEIDLYRVDLSSGQLTPLVKPAQESQFRGYSAASGTAVFRAETREGTYLWISRPDMPKPYLVVATNQFLHEIAEGQLKKIEYRGMDGQELKGWVILPSNYQEGKRYPMVVWVYLGSTFGDVPPTYLTQINRSHALNLQLLAARGYAVLLPSMPSKPPGQASDPYLEMTKGVLPAVEKVIEMGIADAKRVGVMGQSFGGYSTYGLITQTNRFQAAVAMAGLSDLISLYGEFRAWERYTDSAREGDNLLQMAQLEGGPMGNPPWRDAARYLRNSPLFYAERVETPLMIMQGDMDNVAIQQGEEFFTALYRQNKRARFVRYWGEGHVLSSPANIRDMWHQTYAWFDEFLDISRDQRGNVLWDAERVKSRSGLPPLKPEDFARFDELTLKRPQTKPQSANQSQ